MKKEQTEKSLRERMQAKAEEVKKAHKVRRAIYIETNDQDSGEVVGAWFKRPGAAELEAPTALTQQGQAIGAVRVLAQDCFLEGNRALLEDEEYFIQVLPELQELMPAGLGRLEKY
jgi:hypothetical protein